ncbi:SCO family protein [Roseateles sp. DAIF2]|uniref:SCO family protein n=1 Tax=Roseateles sp. DAIF2 TaxID=2714952 RepID=UPI0018A2578C|nr:SCO family protein [Roseateles sp. DAIF2]QPF73973.1 SCO family protein [Roseateles sp. DAIF2]
MKGEAAADRGLAGTLLLCALLAASFLAATAALTEGFGAWTFEELRRARAARGELAVPAGLALRDERGQVLRPWPAEAAGPVRIVDFIYTRCPGVCRALGAEYQRMQALLDGPAMPELLSISFDIEHDDRAALAAHGALYRADPARWRIAAPRTPAERDALLRALGVIAIPDGRGGFVHNAALHLIDGRGRLRAIYDYEAWPQALAHARALAEVRR